MPRKLKILKGPAHRLFALNSGIFAGNEFTELRFWMDKEHPEGMGFSSQDSNVHFMNMKMIGLVKPVEGSVERDEDLFSFIGYLRGCDRHHTWIYVGTYNVRTRQGSCTEYTREEFPENVTLAKDLLEIFLKPDIY